MDRTDSSDESIEDPPIPVAPGSVDELLARIKVFVSTILHIDFLMTYSAEARNRKREVST